MDLYYVIFYWHGDRSFYRKVTLCAPSPAIAIERARQRVPPTYVLEGCYR